MSSRTSLNVWLKFVVSLLSGKLSLIGKQNRFEVFDRPSQTSRNEVAAHLRRARALIVCKGLWTQDAYARDEGGAVIDSKHPDARSFCSSGALFATELSGVVSVESRSLLRRVIQADLEDWNDASGRKQAEVVTAFDLAIHLADSLETSDPTKRAHY